MVRALTGITPATRTPRRATSGEAAERSPRRGAARSSAPAKAGAAPRSPMPRQLPPMLATLASLPPDQAHYAFEYKWDGVRALLYAHRGTHHVESRNLLDITPMYPELRALVAGLGNHSILLDGEIVALDAHGRPDFPLLQHRMHVRNPSAALLARVPIAYMVFDVLHLDGRSLLDLPYTQRRDILESLTIADPGLVPPATRGNDPGAGREMLQTARDLALEGIVAKKLDSLYEPGRRSPAWLKIKIVHTTELVIGGWIPERSTRGDRIGALLLGFHEGSPDKPGLTYAGRVGTGFNDQEHARLVGLLRKIPQVESPFSAPVPAPSGRYGPRLPQAAMRWVRPRLVAQIEYRRWPNADAGGVIQQAAYKGLRTDKPARDIVRSTVRG